MGKSREANTVASKSEMTSKSLHKAERLFSETNIESDETLQNMTSEEWRKAFLRLIKQIGRLSAGGNSVKDIRRERR